jgi:CubicO group peptidase (beta-lactamase class C family)
VVPRQLVGDRRSTFESYVSTAITKFGVPGAAVAVIQGGEVSYLSGFGVKELGGAEPVTPDTRLMIGSITKPMTTMLAAALIDDGRLSWDTRLINLLPQFAAGDRSNDGTPNRARCVLQLRGPSQPRPRALLQDRQTDP